MIHLTKIQARDRWHDSISFWLSKSKSKIRLPWAPSLNTEVDSNGCNFSPALLLNVKEGMPAFEEETFGPLASVTVAGNEKEAIRLANSTKYGLAGSIWTKDIEKGISLARQMDTGAVFINALVKSDPRLPFGGIKKSGYGTGTGSTGHSGICECENHRCG